MADDNLNVRLAAAAQAKVGQHALTSKYGLDCFALVDRLLRDMGAQTAADGDVKITATADYDWGDEFISLEAAGPGDILQFSDHVVSVDVWKMANGKWYLADQSIQTRPHHTAIVVEVREDGSVAVVEQNVDPDRKRVMRNVIPRLEVGTETRVNGSEQKTEIKVTGTVRAYHPALKPPKAAQLLHSRPRSSIDGIARPAQLPRFAALGVQARTHFVPTDGGLGRLPGPADQGSRVANLDDEWNELRWGRESRA